MTGPVSRLAGDRPRLTGVALIGCSLLTTYIHRGIYEAARSGPPQLAEYAMAFLTIMLASTGVLLLIHGARLFARSTPTVPSVDTSVRRRRLRESGIEAIALDSRHGVALLLARKAIAAADERARAGMHRA